MTRVTRRARYGFSLTLYLCGLVALAPSALAQDVTIEQLVTMALEQAPDLTTARTDIAVAAGQVTQAALRPNPEATAGHEQGPWGMFTTTLGVDWPLDLFRQPARVATAQRSADVTSLALLDRERLVAATVRGQAGRVLAARRTLEVTTEALTVARRMRELLDRRVTEGNATKLDVNLAAIEELRLDADAALATGEVEAASIELKGLVGLASDAPLVLRGSLEEVVASPVGPFLTVAAAMSGRPDLRDAIARIGLAEAGAEEARRVARPDVTLVAGYSRAQFGFPQLGFDQRGTPVPIRDTFHSVTIGAKVLLPVSNRSQGALAVAQAERAGATALFSARRLAARAEIDAAVARERHALRAVELYATSVRDLARQNVEVRLEGYDLGRFPLLDVLNEQRRYLEVEAGYTEVLTRAYQAHVAVTRAFGEVP